MPLLPLATDGDMPVHLEARLTLGGRPRAHLAPPAGRFAAVPVAMVAQRQLGPLEELWDSHLLHMCCCTEVTTPPHATRRAEVFLKQQLQSRSCSETDALTDLEP